MRPSASTCQYFAGYRSAGLIGSSMSCARQVGFAPFADGIARESDFFRPESLVQAGLAFEMGHEVVRVRQLFPYLRQEGAAVATVFEDDAVHTGAQLRERIMLAVEFHRFGNRKQGNFA